MCLQSILAIGRAERFSPNSVEKDAAILEYVCNELSDAGFVVRTINEVAIESLPSDITACITMGRCTDTLTRLAEMQRNGVTVINCPESIALCCNRRQVTETLKNAGVNVPAETGSHGYWLKRADGVAEGPGDIRFAADDAELHSTMDSMIRDGISDVMVSAHIQGDLIKFYGVRGSGFFRTFYPGDDGQWKFDDERRNGRPQHHCFSTAGLHGMAEKAAEATCTDVYGGDAIIQADGTAVIIDFNDWPSFSRCRKEAAQAIAALVMERIRICQIRKSNK